MRRVAVCLALCACAASGPRRDATVDVIFGERVADPYRWLETPSEETRRFVDTEDARARRYFASLPSRARFASRLHELAYVERRGVPIRRGTRLFWRLTPADAEKARWMVRDGEAAPRVLLDPATLSSDGRVSVTELQPSWDGRFVTYLRHVDNADEGVLWLREVDSGRDSAIDRIDQIRLLNLSWDATSTGFYYNREPRVADQPESERGGNAEIRYHKLGTPPASDVRVHEALHDPSHAHGVSCTRDGHYLIYFHYIGYANVELSIRDLRRTGSAFEPLAVGLSSDFGIDEWQDRFYVRTNWRAPKYRVLRGLPGQPLERYQEIVPEDGEAVLDGLTLVGGRMGLSWLRSAVSELELRDLDGRNPRPIALPALGSVDGWSGEADQDDAYYTFSTYTTPPQIWRVSAQSGAAELFWRSPVRFDADAFEVSQEWFSSKDGTRVPMFVVRKRGTPRDGTTPFTLTGYGGFALSQTPGFWALFGAWLDAGGGLAEVNLRGGGEFGRAWHESGMGARKQNVFDDFAAAARHLIDARWTSAAHLGIEGWSNGGLLIGAAVTQHPELYRAALIGAPLLDMVRYTRFGTGKAWTVELGSPEVAEQFRALYAYSPYHHVRRTAYPAVLLTSPEADDRVDPMHARKMAAALEWGTTSGRPIWLRVDRHAAHAGADLRKQAVAEYADVLAFFADQLGLK